MSEAAFGVSATSALIGGRAVSRRLQVGLESRISWLTPRIAGRDIVSGRKVLVF